MEITDIKIRKTFDDKPLKAILSVTFDDCLALHDVKIINADNRFFVPCGNKHSEAVFFVWLMGFFLYKKRGRNI